MAFWGERWGERGVTTEVKLIAPDAYGFDFCPEIFSEVWQTIGAGLEQAQQGAGCVLAKEKNISALARLLS